MKKRRIKKIVKSRLHRRKADGDVEFATTDAKIAALASLSALADGTGTGGDLATPGDGLLLAQLGITNPGATNETLDIDRDAAIDAVDAFPRDATDEADADGDGVGNNQEIVTMYKAIVALAGEILALGQPTTDAATAASVQLGIMEAQQLGAGGNDQAYDDAETEYFVQKGIVDANKTASDEKVTEAAELQAAIDALPVPADGITIENLGVKALRVAVAPAVKSGAEEQLDACVTNASTIDTQAALFAGGGGYEARRLLTTDPDDDTPAE